MRTFRLALAWSACACVFAAAPAAARVDDARATRAYLHAVAHFQQGVYAQLGAMVAAMRARESEIGAQCPSALTYAPRDDVFAQIGSEAAFEVDIASVEPVRPLLLHLVRSIAALRWSNRTLSRRVHSLAAEERANAVLVAPNVCSDIAAWRASAYATEPPGTTRLQREFEEEEPGEEEPSIPRLLRPYETRAERRLATRVRRLEAKIERRMAAAAEATRRQLAGALGVTAL